MTSISIIITHKRSQSRCTTTGTKISITCIKISYIITTTCLITTKLITIWKYTLLHTRSILVVIPCAKYIINIWLYIPHKPIPIYTLSSILIIITSSSISTTITTPITLRNICYCSFWAIITSSRCHTTFYSTRPIILCSICIVICCYWICTTWSWAWNYFWTINLHNKRKNRIWF